MTLGVAICSIDSVAGRQRQRAAIGQRLQLGVRELPSELTSTWAKVACKSGVLASHA